jgi:chaperone BCS1
MLPISIKLQVFSGGFGLAVLAAGAQFCRTGAKFGISLLKRHFLVTLEVTSKDRAYPWVLQWLALQGKKTQHLSVETSLRPMTKRSPKKSSVDDKSTQKATSYSSIFSYVPGPGQHFLNYGGQFIAIQRFREQQMVDLNTGKPWEKIQFLSFGRSTKAFESILEESYKLATVQEEGKTIIYTNWGTEWKPFGHARTRRPIESVILDKGVSEKILTDVLEWQNSGNFLRYLFLIILYF